MIHPILVRWQSVVHFRGAALGAAGAALRVALVPLGCTPEGLAARLFCRFVMLLLVFQAKLLRFLMRLDCLLNWRLTKTTSGRSLRRLAMMGILAFSSCGITRMPSG